MGWEKKEPGMIMSSRCTMAEMSSGSREQREIRWISGVSAKRQYFRWLEPAADRCHRRYHHQLPGSRTEGGYQPDLRERAVRRRRCGLAVCGNAPHHRR